MTAAGGGVPAPLDKPEPVDGRRLRSARTRQLIIDAYLALLRERPQIPTAASIAHRAGYSVRSVFERFPDLHALRVAATDEALLRGAATVAARPAIGTRAERLKVHVEMRGRSCDEWLPLWRALNANQGDSPELKARVRLIREMVMRRIEEVYAPELSTLDEHARRQTVLALESLVDFESWARLRGQFELSFDEACAVWVRAIDRLLPPAPADC
ncbi:TetR/AcrR family transcriptional regulator [Reyranella sp.]|uniref:TetR/AcrR family transcriptional regulator n=1 Tax=Reyranella sp. TaxID=1929291 RepID=UPI003D1073F9